MALWVLDVVIVCGFPILTICESLSLSAAMPNGKIKGLWKAKPPYADNSYDYRLFDSFQLSMEPSYNSARFWATSAALKIAWLSI